nr:MAG TPA: hypothetical protein [Caudoviricetes sp.]
MSKYGWDDTDTVATDSPFTNPTAEELNSTAPVETRNVIKIEDVLNVPKEAMADTEELQESIDKTEEEVNQTSIAVEQLKDLLSHIAATKQVSKETRTALLALAPTVTLESASEYTSVPSNMQVTETATACHDAICITQTKHVDQLSTALFGNVIALYANDSDIRTLDALKAQIDGKIEHLKEVSDHYDDDFYQLRLSILRVRNTIAERLKKIDEDETYRIHPEFRDQVISQEAYDASVKLTEQDDISALMSIVKLSLVKFKERLDTESKMSPWKVIQDYRHDDNALDTARQTREYFSQVINQQLDLVNKSITELYNVVLDMGEGKVHFSAIIESKRILDRLVNDYLNSARNTAYDSKHYLAKLDVIKESETDEDIAKAVMDLVLILPSDLIDIQYQSYLHAYRSAEAYANYIWFYHQVAEALNALSGHEGEVVRVNLGDHIRQLGETITAMARLDAATHNFILQYTDTLKAAQLSLLIVLAAMKLPEVGEVVTHQVLSQLENVRAHAVMALKHYKLELMEQ